MATTSKVCKIQRNIGQVTRCSNRAAEQVKSSTKRGNYNGFLNYVFKPFYNIVSRSWQIAEREFFYSLSNLCNLYGWRVPDTSKVSYPQNVMSAFEIVKDNCIERNLDCFIAMSGRSISIVTMKTFDIDCTLFYIPVRPVWLLLQNQPQNVLTEIWLEIFRYLYLIANVPFYREDSYLYRIYEILQNWILDDDDMQEEEYKKEQQETINTMQYAGDKLLVCLMEGFNAQKLQELLNQYLHLDCYDNDTEKIITDCLQLTKDYPNRSIYNNIINVESDTEQEDMIYIDNYLSFFWSSNDCLYDSFMEMINAELMEMTGQQEPITLQCFDKPQLMEQHDFDFEKRFFMLVHDISSVLHKLDNV